MLASTPNGSRSPTSASTAWPAPTSRPTTAGIARWLRRHGWTTDERLVRNDTFAVLRAGTDRDVGGRRRLRLRHQLLRRGTRRPDHPVPRGRADLRATGVAATSSARLALWHAIRSEDGRGPKTALQRAMPADFGLTGDRRRCMEALLLRQARRRPARRARAGRVRRPRSDGDAVARSIVDRQADEVVALATTAIRRLRHDTRSTSMWCSAAGSSATTIAVVLRPDPTTASPQVAPAADVTRPHAIHRSSGAAMLGLDRVGATRAAHAELRRCLDPRAARRPHSPPDGRSDAAMAKIVLDQVSQGVRQRRDRRQRRLAGDRRRRVHGAGRTVRLRQVDDPADPRRSRGGHRGRGLHRRHAGHRPAAQGPRHRDGVPELRPLPAHDASSRTWGSA